MDAKDLRIGLMLGPHFGRMATSFGFAKGYFHATEASLLPVPYYGVGVSSGAIMLGSVAPWNARAFTFGERKLTNLTGTDFFSPNRDLMVWGGLDLIGSLLLSTPWEELIKNKWFRNALRALALTSLIGIEAKILERLFNSNAVFSSKLLKLLMESMDFDGTFSSPIRVEIVAADINGDEKRNKNVRLSSVTNFKPEDRNLEKSIRNRRFAEGIVKSSSVTGFFPTIKNDKGHFDTDGAIYSAFPLHLATGQGCDVIVVGMFTYAGQGFIDHNYTKWMSALHRAMDIVIDNHSGLVIQGCLNINNDLEKISNIRKHLDYLKDFYKVNGDTIGGKLHQTIAGIEDELTGLTAHGKRFVNLVIVRSRKIPEFDFRHFNAAVMREGREIGEEAFHDSKTLIDEAMSLAWARRRTA